MPPRPVYVIKNLNRLIVAHDKNSPLTYGPLSRHANALTSTTGCQLRSQGAGPVLTMFRAQKLTAARRISVATKPHTIDEYLAGLSPENRAALQKVRRAVHAAAPAAEECISYGIPAFRLNGKLIAGFKAGATHCSFHPMSGDTVATLKADLDGYHTSRGTIRFSARAGLPATLVRKLVKTRIAER